MPSVRFHETTFAWSCEGMAVDPLADVLAMLDPQPSPGVDLTLRRATARAAADPREEGFLPSFFHGAVQAYAGPSGFLLWDRSSRVVIPSDGSAASGEIVPPDAERHAGSTAVLFQVALTLILRRARLFHLHAAAVVRPDGAAVIIAGGSGAGKTTTALALLEAGYHYLGDDALFLQRQAGAPAPRAIAFPRAFHLGPATLSAFPRILPLAGPTPPRSDKRSVDPRLAFPGRHRPEIPLSPGQTIAVFPTISGASATELVPITKAEAFGQLLASSASLVVAGLPHRDENLALLRALVDAATCLELRLGEDALEAPVATIAARFPP